MTSDTAISIAVPVAVFLIMFAIGLGLTRRDFEKALRSPRALLLGVVAQMALVPFAGLLLVAAHRPEAGLALGIVILVLCPGGAMSNLLTRLAGGDVALSVSLTAITNILSIATLPALSALAAEHFLGAAVGRLDIGDLVLRVAMISTVPVLLGIVLRHLAPRPCARHEAAVFRGAFIIFLVLIVWSILASIQELRAGMLALGWQLAMLSLLLLGLGFVIAWLCGIGPPQRITLAIETGIQNGGLGLAVGSMLWVEGSGFPLPAIPSGVYGVLMYLLTFPLVILLAAAARRRALPALPGDGAD
jgi:BASS family bile acid:Na+ symporter